MNRTEILNFLVEKNGYTSYLEIGVQAGKNFADVKVAFKVGVDPDSTSSKATHHLTSDDFFKKNRLY